MREEVVLVRAAMQPRTNEAVGNRRRLCRTTTTATAELMSYFYGGGLGLSLSPRSHVLHEGESQWRESCREEGEISEKIYPTTPPPPLIISKQASQKLHGTAAAEV